MQALRKKARLRTRCGLLRKYGCFPHYACPATLMVVASADNTESLLYTYSCNSFEDKEGLLLSSIQPIPGNQWNITLFNDDIAF